MRRTRAFPRDNTSVLRFVHTNGPAGDLYTVDYGLQHTYLTLYTAILDQLLVLTANRAFSAVLVTLYTVTPHAPKSIADYVLYAVVSAQCRDIGRQQISPRRSSLGTANECPGGMANELRRSRAIQLQTSYVTVASKQSPFWTCDPTRRSTRMPKNTPLQFGHANDAINRKEEAVMLYRCRVLLGEETGGLTHASGCFFVEKALKAHNCTVDHDPCKYWLDLLSEQVEDAL